MPPAKAPQRVTPGSIADLLSWLRPAETGPAVPLPEAGTGNSAYDPNTLANRLDNPSVVDPMWLQAARKVADTGGSLLDILKGTITGGGEQPGMTAENLGAIIAAASPLLGKIVYHGSPHVFAPEPGAPLGRFRMDKIGTGEGAQAYGHGLYLAENPSVAMDYQKRLSGGASSAFSGQSAPIPSMSTASRISKVFGDDGMRWKIERPNGDEINIADIARKWAIDKKVDPAEGITTYKFKDGSAIVTGEMGWDAITLDKGALYNVDLPDSAIANMLDWDAPLSQQPEAVKKALAKVDPDMYSPAGADYDPMEQGQIAYNRLASMLGGQGKATEALRSAGIPGIRYYDGASRGAGQGTRNYVVFDDALPKIVKVTR
jgi:hypothetical protein